MSLLLALRQFWRDIWRVEECWNCRGTGQVRGENNVLIKCQFCRKGKR